MCVIAAKPAGVSWLGCKEMRNCFTRNADGAGIAWVDEKGVIRGKKGYFKFKTLYKDLKELEQYSVMLHCRLATHGSKSAKNCHPFMLKNGTVMAHNGIIDIKPMIEDMTDSETFGKQYIEQFKVCDLEKDHIKKLIETAIGKSNKICLLKKSGDFLIFNKEQGVEKQGIWFSNKSYEPYVAPTYSAFDWGSYYSERYRANSALDEFGYLDDDEMEDLPADGSNIYNEDTHYCSICGQPTRMGIDIGKGFIACPDCYDDLEDYPDYKRAVYKEFSRKVTKLSTPAKSEETSWVNDHVNEKKVS